MAAPPRLDTLVVIGVGLIGAALALALRRQGAVRRVIGVGRTRANLDAASAIGAIDEACTLDQDWRAAIDTADLVMLATVSHLQQVVVVEIGRAPCRDRV